MAKSKFTPSSGKRNNIEYARSWPKTIKKIIGGVVIVGVAGWLAMGGVAKLASHYYNLKEHWQTRSENVEKKVAETGIAYIPLVNNTNILDFNSKNIINPDGIEKITGLALSGWAGKSLRNNLGDLAENVYKNIKSDLKLQGLNIDSIYVKPDGKNAYIAALVRNNQGDLELVLQEYTGYNRLLSAEEQKKKAFDQMNNALTQRKLALDQKVKVEETLTETKTKLGKTEGELKKTKESYAVDEQIIKDEYTSLEKKYPGIKLNPDINYNLKFELSETGTEEAIITQEIKEGMSLVEKKNNLEFLKKYMKLARNIDDATEEMKPNNLDMEKLKFDAAGVKTIITPLEDVTKIEVIKDGAVNFKRSNLRYFVDLKEIFNH